MTGRVFDPRDVGMCPLQRWAKTSVWFTIQGQWALAWLSLALMSAVVTAGTPDTDVARVAHDLPAAAFAADVLVVGERHQKTRSYALARRLIDRALSAERCVSFALEIGHDQTGRWRALASRPGAARALALSPIHDSPGLRRLLRDTSKLAQHACLKLNGIDWKRFEPIEHPGGRDWLMAERIADLVAPDQLVIAWVGANHAPHHIDWDHDELGQSTTFYLDARGLNTYVVVEDWRGTAPAHVYAADTPVAIAAFNAQQSHRSVTPARSLSRYAERLIVWPAPGAPAPR